MTLDDSIEGKRDVYMYHGGGVWSELKPNMSDNIRDSRLSPQELLALVLSSDDPRQYVDDVRRSMERNPQTWQMIGENLVRPSMAAKGKAEGPLPTDGNYPLAHSSAYRQWYKIVYVRELIEDNGMVFQMPFDVFYSIGSNQTISSIMAMLFTDFGIPAMDGVRRYGNWTWFKVNAGDARNVEIALKAAKIEYTHIHI